MKTSTYSGTRKTKRMRTFKIKEFETILKFNYRSFLLSPVQKIKKLVEAKVFKFFLLRQVSNI